LNRNELLALAIEFSDASQVNCLNAVYGDGSSHVADVETEIRERAGQLQMKFDVRDRKIGLHVTVQAEGPAAIVNRGMADPAGVPLRGLNAGIAANGALNFAQQFDALVVPVTAANITLNVGQKHPHHHHADGGNDDQSDRGSRNLLHLPGGSLPTVSIGPSFQFQRNYETFFAPQ